MKEANKEMTELPRREMGEGVVGPWVFGSRCMVAVPNQDSTNKRIKITRIKQLKLKFIFI